MMPLFFIAAISFSLPRHFRRRLSIIDAIAAMPCHDALTLYAHFHYAIDAIFISPLFFRYFTPLSDTPLRHFMPPHYFRRHFAIIFFRRHYFIDFISFSLMPMFSFSYYYFHYCHYAILLLFR
jgi:hypothetical protein